ncbi:hypothetical protein EYF80_013354 [Liparis tanakae]|uniref:Uncharacterized protein n=1 Tax=Liparis tanakae TaxID=230148 RepID=A0A4Z2IEF7_9TELE|nr:hypothetical protein EYF80_013354 [Liparis tanakae]
MKDGLKPNEWEAAAPRPRRLALWNKTIHFLFCGALEEILAAVVVWTCLGLEWAARDTHQRAYSHWCVCTAARHNERRAVAAVLEADGGTCRRTGRK